MENNTKIAIGLAAAVVVGYIVYKSKNPKSTTSSGKCTGEFAVECNDGSCDVGNGDSLPCLGKRGGVKGGANYNTDYGYGSFKTGLDPTGILEARRNTSIKNEDGIIFYPSNPQLK